MYSILCVTDIGSVYIDVEGQKRVHAGVSPKCTLDPAQERLCRVDIVLVLEEST